MCLLPDSYDASASDIIVLCLVRNTSILDAVENRILDSFDTEGDIRPEKHADVVAKILDLARDALPYIDRLYFTATRVQIRTETDRKSVV